MGEATPESKAEAANWLALPYTVGAMGTALYVSQGLDIVGFWPTMGLFVVTALFWWQVWVRTVGTHLTPE